MPVAPFYKNVTLRLGKQLLVYYHANAVPPSHVLSNLWLAVNNQTPEAIRETPLFVSLIGLLATPT